MKFALSFCFAALLSLCGMASDGMADSLEEYRTRGVTIVHTEQAEPHFFKGHDGQPRGILVDFWNLWSRKTNIPIQFRMVPWKQTVAMTLSGEADIHGGLAKIDERLDTFDFSTPIYPIRASLFVRGNTKVSLETIVSDYTIGAVTNAHTERILYELYPGIKVRPYDTPQQVLKALATGRIDGISMDLPTLYFNNDKLDQPMVVTPCETLFVNELHGGIRKGNPALLRLINDGFAKITDTERKMILDRWLVVQPPHDPWSDYAPWLALVAFLLVGAVTFILKGGLRSGNRSKK